MDSAVVNLRGVLGSNVEAIYMAVRAFHDINVLYYDIYIGVDPSRWTGLAILDAQGELLTKLQIHPLKLTQTKEYQHLLHKYKNKQICLVVEYPDENLENSGSIKYLANLIIDAFEEDFPQVNTYRKHPYTWINYFELTPGRIKEESIDKAMEITTSAFDTHDESDAFLLVRAYFETK